MQKPYKHYNGARRWLSPKLTNWCSLCPRGSRTKVLRWGLGAAPLRTLPQVSPPMCTPHAHVYVFSAGGVPKNRGFFSPGSALHIWWFSHIWTFSWENSPFSSKWNRLWRLKASFTVKWLTWHTPKLCTCSLYYYIFLVLSPDHTLCYTKVSLVTLVDFLGIFQGQTKILIIFINLRLLPNSAGCLLCFFNLQERASLFNTAVTS